MKRYMIGVGGTINFQRKIDSWITSFISANLKDFKWTLLQVF